MVRFDANETRNPEAAHVTQRLHTAIEICFYTIITLHNMSNCYMLYVDLPIPPLPNVPIGPDFTIVQHRARVRYPIRSSNRVQVAIV